MKIAAAFAFFGLVACSGKATSPPTGEDAGQSDGGDAGESRPDAGDDAGFACVPGGEPCPCTGAPIGDAGFSSLATLPVAELCAQSESAAGPELMQVQCGSLILVEQAQGDCVPLWLFDATTGTLEVVGGGCDVVACRGIAQGFQFPSDCDFFGGSCPCASGSTNLCTSLDAGTPVDAGPDGGTTDAASDSAADASSD